MFASKYQLRFSTTSRRDDLISLCYMFIFLANGFEFPIIDLCNQLENKNDSNHMGIIFDYKWKYSLAEMVKAIKFENLSK